MKQTEVIALLHNIVAGHQEYTTWTVSTPHLVMLVNKVIEDEREACAKVCETKHFSSPIREAGAKNCAAAIRARGNA